MVGIINLHPLNLWVSIKSPISWFLIQPLDWGGTLGASILLSIVCEQCETSCK